MGCRVLGTQQGRPAAVPAALKARGDLAKAPAADAMPAEPQGSVAAGFAAAHAAGPAVALAALGVAGYHSPVAQPAT